MFPGVTAQVQPVINYGQPVGTDTAQVLGYLQPITAQEMKQRDLPETGFSGVDLVGQSGLEGEYDQAVARHRRGRAVLGSTPLARSRERSSRTAGERPATTW